MQIGQKVKGVYASYTKFSGKIIDFRFLTVQCEDCVEVKIELDESVLLFGKMRETLLVYTKQDGSPSTYTKCADSLTLL